MRQNSRRGGAALHHLANIATGEADIAQQVVVELHEVGKGAPAGRALEQGRDQAHFQSSFFVGFGVAARNGAAYDGRALNGI